MDDTTMSIVSVSTNLNRTGVGDQHLPTNWSDANIFSHLRDFESAAADDISSAMELVESSIPSSEAVVVPTMMSAASSTAPASSLITVGAETFVVDGIGDGCGGVGVGVGTSTNCMVNCGTGPGGVGNRRDIMTSVPVVIESENIEQSGTGSGNMNEINAQELSYIQLEELSKLANNSEGCENAYMLDEENAQEFLDYLKMAVPENAVLTNETNKQSVINDYQIQCANCDTLFALDTFDDHVCDYDDDKTLIKLEPTEEPPETVPTIASAQVECESGPVTDEPICLILTRDNNQKLRKIFKDLFKTSTNAVPVPPDPRKRNGTHACTMCDRKFVHASGLSRHLEKHEQDRLPILKQILPNVLPVNVISKCLACNRNFNSVTGAMDHWNSDHELIETKLKENDMSEDENDEEELKDIVNVSTEKEKTLQFLNTEDIPFKAIILSALLQCEFCDFTFSDVNALMKHEACHDPSRGYECAKCGISCMILRDIVMHWQTECTYTTVDKSTNINLRTYFVCNVCSNKYVSLEQLYEHRYEKLHFFPRYSEEKGSIQVGCEKCGGLHDSAKSIIVHHNQFHVKKTKKDTTTSGCSKYRQYLCDICGKSYTQSSHLWQHLRFHKGVKPFACKEPNCNRRFTIRPDLNDHIRKCHTGERPYHCLICGKRFLTGSVFYQHRLIHRGERRYGCEECGKRFYRADALKNHQRIHTGEKPYSCGQCPKSFRQRGDRDKHLRARHGSAPFMLNSNINYSGPIRNDARLKATGMTKKNDDIVYVGNMAFPKSMFRPVLKDIDANTYIM